MNLARRLFLQDGFRVVSLGLALPHIFTRAVEAADLARGTSADSAAEDALSRRTLVVVQMAGGNDGLNTVVPYQAGQYYETRRGLSIPGEEVLPLDDRYGLHPALGGLKRLWDEGVLSVVMGVGYPNPNLSHFKSMDIWQTADPEGRGSEGWLAKLVKGATDRRGHPRQGSPFAALAAAGNLPPALASPDLAVPTVDNVNTHRLLPDPRYPQDAEARRNALLQLYGVYPAESPYASALASTAATTQEGIDLLQQVHESYQPAVEYPRDGFASGLKLLAEAITGELGVRVGYITIGGFDTHSNQRNTHQRLLQSLSDGLAAFWDDLKAHGKGDDVLIMTWSEFGRRVAENGSAGTDHGTAAPQLLIGGGLQGGLWGEPPSLASLDNGNLRFTTDFRSVYATVMDGWLGVPPEQLLGRRFPVLGFLGGGS